MVRVVTLAASVFGTVGRRAHVIYGSVCSGIEAGLARVILNAAGEGPIGFRAGMQEFRVDIERPSVWQ